MLNHSVKLANQLNKISSSKEEIEVIVEQTVEEIDEGLKKSKHKISNVKAEDIFLKRKMIKLNKRSLEKILQSVKTWRHQS